MSSKEQKAEVAADEVTETKKDSVKGTKRPAEVRHKTSCRHFLSKSNFLRMLYLSKCR